MKKQLRIKHIDSTWLWFTPLAFLNMGGTDTYLVQKYEGIWPFGKWKELYRSKSKEYCYVSLMKEKYNLEVPCEFEWNWNARYEWFSKVGKLRLIEREGNFFAGYYDEEKSKYKISYISKISFEDAIIGLINILLKITYKHRCEYNKIKL